MLKIRSFDVPSSAPAPAERQGHAAVLFHHSLIIFGGRAHSQPSRTAGERNYLADVWSFDLRHCVWTQPQCSGTAPTARHNHSAVLWRGNRMVVYGGAGADGYCEDMFMLDLEVWCWTQVIYEPNPTAVAAVAAVAATATDGDDAEHETETAPLLCPHARNGHSCIIHNDTLVVIGGSYAPSHYSNDVHLFDLNTRQWQTSLVVAGSKPPARNWHSAVLVEGEFVVVFGGYSYIDCTEVYHNDLHAFSLRTHRWHLLSTSKPPHVRNRHVCQYFPLSGQLFIHGGNYLDSARDVFLADAFVLDLSTIRQHILEAPAEDAPAEKTATARREKATPVPLLKWVALKAVDKASVLHCGHHVSALYVEEGRQEVVVMGGELKQRKRSNAVKALSFTL